MYPVDPVFRFEMDLPLSHPELAFQPLSKLAQQMLVGVLDVLGGLSVVLGPTHPVGRFF